MEHAEGMMHGMQLHMIVVGFSAVLLGALLVGFVYVLTRPASAAGTNLADFSAARSFALPPKSNDDGDIVAGAMPAVDTVFVLPDISNYTRFMTGTQFSFAHAQHIIFSLINAMILAATRKIELSKLEGDAALFFVDAEKLTDTELGDTIVDIFAAFFRERERLKASNICPCHACRHIDTLDLKIFVHRGEAARFNFRGSVDLFGTDVIVLHRIMKNNLSGHRYVMVTEAAAASVTFPQMPDPTAVEQDVDHIGRLKATVFPIDDVTAMQLATSGNELSNGSRSVLGETLQKLRENMRTVSLWRGPNQPTS